MNSEQIAWCKENNIPAQYFAEVAEIITRNWPDEATKKILLWFADRMAGV